MTSLSSGRNYRRRVPVSDSHKVATGIALVCIGLLIVAIYQSQFIEPQLPANTASEHIRSWLDNPPVFKNDDGSYVRLYHIVELKKLYRSNRNQLIWFNNYKLSDEGRLLIQSLRETVADDRYMYSYHLPAILNAVKQLVSIPSDVTALDLLLSEAYVTFAQDSLNNDFLPDLNAHDHVPVQSLQVSSVKSRSTTDEVIYQLQQNLETESLQQLIASLTPRHSGYLKLREQLEFYQNLASTNQWLLLEEGPVLDSGMRHPQVRVVRTLLDVLGYVDQKHPEITAPWRQNSEVWDEGLQQMINRYQQQNGLKITGTLSAETRKALQESPNRIARRIAFNMKRWRHLPENLGARYLMANMASFDMKYVADGESRLQMKIIIGRPNRRTPTLIEYMGSMAINPSWTIPMGIARQYVLPKVRQDNNYLADNDLEIYKIDKGESTIIDPYSINWQAVDEYDLPFWFRQKPGDKNALGRVKFNLPNKLSIYFHDTNHPELFSGESLALSSGCVRLEKPLELARLLLLEKDQWDQQRIDSAFKSNTTSNVKLKNDVPVYLLYLTAWVDENDQLQQRPDIYDWDQLDNIGSDNQSAILATELIEILSP